jgi:hypothetical protein
MSSANFDYYIIDLGDIWDYEREKFIAGESNENFAEKIMVLTQENIIKLGQPSFGEKMISSDSNYYRRNVTDYREADLTMKYKLDYFFNKDNCYEYTQTLIITRNERDFDFIFALKLRQYNDNLFKVQDFLGYHLINTFSNDSKSFIQYLTISILQFDYLFNEGLKRQVKVFISLYEDRVVDDMSASGNTDQNKSDPIGKLESKNSLDKKNKATDQKLKIWAGTQEQLSLFYYRLIEKELIYDMDKEEFINHFNGENYINKINWLEGNEVFIELFDKLATYGFINIKLLKDSSDNKNNKVVIMAKILGHFIFKGASKNAQAFNKSRHQYYSTKATHYKYVFIEEIIDKIKSEHKSL